MLPSIKSDFSVDNQLLQFSVTCSINKYNIHILVFSNLFYHKQTKKQNNTHFNIIKTYIIKALNQLKKKNRKFIFWVFWSAVLQTDSKI